MIDNDNNNDVDALDFEDLTKDQKLKIMRKEREKWDTYWKDNIETARHHVNFVMNAYGKAQYDQETLNYYTENKKPALSFNKLYIPILQTEGEYRQLAPQVEVVCYDPEIDQEQINLRADFIRGKMYDQNGEQINIKTFKNAMIYGYAVEIVVTDYLSSEPFNQEILIESLDDPTVAYFDPIAKKPNKQDGRFCGYIKYEDINVLKARYPKKNINKVDFETNYATDRKWFDSDDNLVAICYHWKKIWIKEMWYLMSDGKSLNENSYQKLLEQKKEIKKQLKELQSKLYSGLIGPDQLQQIMQIESNLNESLQEFPKIVKEKEIDVPEIKFYKFIATEILEEGEFKFDHTVLKDALPMVYIDGDSYIVNGKQRIRPICIDGIDTQKLINYEQSTKAHKLKTSHLTKLVMTQKRFAGSDKESLKNPEESGIMIVGDSENMNDPMPSNMPESTFPAILADMAMKDEQQLQSIIGRFDASYGRDAREVSGIAYGKKTTQSNLASYIYFSNNFYGISHTAKLILAMMPIIYDSSRTISGLDDSKKLKFYKINENETNQIGNNSDKFDVYITVGSTFQEQKQQRMQELITFMQSMGLPSFNLVGDILAKSLNNDYAPEMLKRVKEYMLDPRVKAELSGEPQPPPQQPQPSPKDQADIAKSQAQIASSQIKADAEKYKADKEREIAELEATKSAIDTLESHEKKQLKHDMYLLKKNLT